MKKNKKEVQTAKTVPAAKGGAVRTIGFIMLISLAGKILGLVREVLTGAALGASGQGAAFNLATALPRNFLDIAFASAISGCFIPVFNQTLQKEGKDAAFDLANAFISLVLIISAAFTVLAVVFSGRIAAIMGAGFEADVQALTARLFVITMPIVVFSALAFSLIGILQSFGEFNIPAAMSVVSNGVIIVYCVFFAERYGVVGLAAVFLAGWGLQVLIQVPALKKTGYRPRFTRAFSHPGLKEIRVLVLPVMISTWVLPVNDMVNISVQTLVSEAASTAYSKANVLYSVITGVFVLSIANYVLPGLTRLHAGDDIAGFGDTLRAAVRSLIYFLIPMSAGLYLLAQPLARLVFLAGLFDETAASLTADALRFLCFGMLGFGLQTILSRAFYAQKNAIAPLFTGIAAVALNAVLAFWLKEHLQIGGPALASSCAFTVVAAVMLVFLYRQNRRVLDKAVFRDFVKTAAAAAVMCLAVAAFLRATADMPQTRMYDLIKIGVSAAGGAAVYFICTLALGVAEAKTAAGMVRGLFKKLS